MLIAGFDTRSTNQIEKRLMKLKKNHSALKLVAGFASAALIAW